MATTNGKTELWLVRHGVTDWNIERRFQGSKDIPINAAGVEQARAAAQQLRGKNFAALYSSPLQRAYQTAQVISQVVGLPIQPDARLIEGCQGSWEGMLFDEIEQLYPGERELHHTQPAQFRPPGGENLTEVAQRVAQAADDIAFIHPGEKVLVVSHGMALSALISLARGLPLNGAFEFIMPNAAVETVQWQPGNYSIPEN